MKRTFMILCALMISIVNVFSQPVEYQWATTAGGTALDFGDGVAVDAAGNAFITGTFRYSMNLLGTEFEPVSEQNTMFLAKVSPEQELLWAVTAEADGVTGAGGFKVQYHDGYVYVLGDLRGDATFFSADFSETSLSATTRALYVAKYTENGLLEWVRKMESSHAGGIVPTGSANNLAVDEAGAVYVTTQFRTDIDINGTLVDPEGSGGTNFHALLVKFDALGAYQWHWNSTHPGDDRGEGIAVTPEGNIMFSVRYSSSVTVNEVLYENDGGGIMFIELESDGSYVWNHNMTTSETNRAFLWDIQPDHHNNVFIGGASRTTLGWDEDNIFEPENGLRTNAFIFKLDADRELVYTSFFGDPDQNTSARAVKIAPSGKLLIAGETIGEMELNDDIIITAAGGSDIFYAMMDPVTGDFLAGDAFGGESNELFGMMTVSQNGDIYFIGRFLNEFIVEDDTFESEGSFDIFFVKYLDLYEEEDDPFADVLFSEDFNDGDAADRWTFSEIGGTNVIDFAFDYVAAGIPALPGKEEGTGLKIAVNTTTAGASTSALIAFPDDQHFSGEYRLAFDLWMNLEVGSGGTTEHVVFGGGHTSTAIQMPWSGTGSVDGVPGTGPSDNGIDYAMTCDNGAARDVRAFVDGAELLGAAGGFADPTMQSTQWAPYNEAYEGDIPGNQWLHITVDFLADRTIFKVNGHVWAETMQIANPGNIMLGYIDFWASVANENSYIVYDNVKVWGEDSDPDPDTYIVTFQIENEAGEAIDDATVTLAGVANAPGDYVFEVSPGTYNYTVTAEGYEDAAGSVVVVNEDIDVNVVLVEEEEFPPATPLSMITIMDKTGENLPDEIGSGGNARAAALYMDRYVIVPSREDGPNVWVWDSENPDDDPVALDAGDGYTGGLFVVNYVRTVGENIYVSNMTLDASNPAHPFKVYRWNALDAEPEVVLSATGAFGRIGDVFSIIGDPQTHGYIMAHRNGSKDFWLWELEDGEVLNENEPELIVLGVPEAHINTNGIFNPIPGEDNLFIVTSNIRGMFLANLEGEVLAEWSTAIIEQRTYDPNIFYYDGKRFLTYTINNEGNPTVGARYQVIDISMGTTVQEAFAAITNSNELAERLVYDKSMGTGHPSLNATNQVVIDDNGDALILAHVVGRGFILETIDPDPEPPETFALILLVNPEDAGTVSGAGDYAEGASVVLTATPNEGFQFENWTDDDDNIINEQASFLYTMPGEDVTLTANFSELPDSFMVTFTVLDEDEEEITDAVITLGTVTNEPGEYEFTVLPGTYNYTVVAEDYETATGSVVVVDADVAVTVIMISDEPLPPADPIEMITIMDKTGANVPPQIGTGGNARSAALYMDRYVIVPSREGGNNVWVWDSHNPDEPPFALDPGDGYESGLFVINFVRTAGEYIYVSNLTLGTNNWHPFKMYRWHGLEAEPEVLINLTYDVVGGDPNTSWGRLGDAFSIIGDPSADGHILAHVNSGGDGQRNFRKWNFVDGELVNHDEPELVTLDGAYNMNSFGVYNAIEGEDDLFLVTGNGMGIAVADLEGQVHAYIPTSVITVRTMDPRIFYYDGNRYLSYVVNKEGEADGGAYYEIIDISIGEDVIEAFENITSIADLDARRAHSFIIGGGSAFLSATHDISWSDNGTIKLLSHVVARGFVLESTELVEPETFTVTFVVKNHLGDDLDDAIITFGEFEGEPGEYVFENIGEGTYEFSVSAFCYLYYDDEVFIDGNIEIEVSLSNLPGDATGDGVINILDVISTSSFWGSGGMEEPASWCFVNADINSDGIINVLDIIGITNIFAGGKISPFDDLKSETVRVYKSEYGISVETDGTIAGFEFEITGDIFDLELKLELPNHELLYVYENGSIRAMIYSFDNTPFPSGKNELITFDRQVQTEWSYVLAGNLNAQEVPVTTHDQVTGINETTDINFVAYPNPVSDMLWVEFNNSANTVVSLLDIQGQVVESHSVKEAGHQQLRIDVAGLPTGVYMLRIDHNNTVITERIMIK